MFSKLPNLGPVLFIITSGEVDIKAEAPLKIYYKQTTGNYPGVVMPKNLLHEILWSSLDTQGTII